MNTMDKYRTLEIISLFVKHEPGERYITERVSQKAMEVVRQMKNKYFEELPISVYPSKWHTLCIDFGETDKELSLEIGYKSLGYFTNDKQVDKLDIEIFEEIIEAVIEVETDLEKLFYGK